MFSQEIIQTAFRECGLEDLDEGHQVQVVPAFAFHGAVPSEPDFDDVVYFGRMDHEVDFAVAARWLQSCALRES